MRRTILVVVAVLLVCSVGLPMLAQSSNPTTQSVTSQGPRTSQGIQTKIDHPYAPTAGGPRPPDMVCFGHYPDWSLQFTGREARYLGYNEPDRYFRGDFRWVPDEKTWNWQQTGRQPGNENFPLTASIQQNDCRDSAGNATLPYSATVYLPQGDMVSGCCRKLKPNESAIGPHGLPASQAAPNAPSAQPQELRKATGVPAGRPVEQ